MEEKLKGLDRRYKVCKVMKWVTLILSVACAILPAVIVAIRVAPSMPKVGVWQGISGCAMFVLALGLLFILRGLGKKYGHKLPWATTALIWGWVLYLIITSIKKVISQMETISLALAIGISVGFVLSIASELFAVLETGAEEEYKRLK